ncbi:response regulator transcription factor [Ahrensia sp. R2A130]|uniref:response regulator transcription factor n=1 Tax=Ahrensia sp. R2A130 TaxID=744979 RepID=UPI0001E0D14D|nr:response regulator transcription factor [Ahrensia sp. R2A130]EFL87678.1 putative two-component response regulator protein [Ahrensia sp. R2A130]
MTKILLIDDNAHQHELFRCYTMNSDDLEMRYSQELQAAVDVIAEDMPNIVLLDNRLHPFTDFRKTVPKIREAGFDGKIVVISSDVDHPVFQDAPNYAVHCCIDKADLNLKNFREKMVMIADQPAASAT